MDSKTVPEHDHHLSQDPFAVLPTHFRPGVDLRAPCGAHPKPSSTTNSTSTRQGEPTSTANSILHLSSPVEDIIMTIIEEQTAPGLIQERDYHRSELHGFEIDMYGQIIVPEFHPRECV